MDLLIAILMWMGIVASPEQLSNVRFNMENQAAIEKANTIIDSGSYKIDAKTGIVIVDGAQ